MYINGKYQPNQTRAVRRAAAEKAQRWLHVSMAYVEHKVKHPITGVVTKVFMPDRPKGTTYINPEKMTRRLASALS